jgi:malonyl-CoA/methylmalonyl-CoA synthetase
MTILLERLLAHPWARPAILQPSGDITYGQLLSGSAHVARRLLDGRRSLAGDRVALLLPPGASFVATLFGIWQAGGIAVPLSALQTPAELEHILAVAAPAATVVDPQVAGHLNALVAAAGSTRLGRRVDAVEAVEGAANSGGHPQVGDVTAHDRAGHDAALMLFTSGTTGKPKGVCLSHDGIAATLSSLAEAWRWRSDDRLLHVLPLYHTHGLIVALLGALWAGASTQFMAFEAAATWDAFERASVFMAVPTIYVRLMEAFVAGGPAERARWSRGARGLRLATSGSAALPASLHQAFAAAAGQQILERYGMTEIGMALGNPYDGPRVPGSVGLPLPGVSVEIVDDDDRPVPDEQPGELRVRSPQLFLGYHGDPDATAASYDRAGRFRTGDTGVRSADGTIRLLGRTSIDILKSGGYKLSALEIENVLATHPDVREVAVVGVPDPVWGDCVTACVVPRTGAALTIDGLRDFARDALAPYKLPRALRLLSALPRNPMGKVQKSLLK